MKTPWVGCFVLLGIFAPAWFVSAATLYMDPGKAEINRGDVITLAVRLDTDEGECINAVDATINYSENIEPIDTSRGESILSIWLEDPVINKANRTITFAAGIPNGYCGRIIGDPRLSNNVIKLVFSSPGFRVGSTESGNVASVSFGNETRALLNDGFGTDAPLQTFDAEILLTDKLGSGQNNDWLTEVNNDNTPPQQFSISLERSPNAFANKYFIVFNTTDKQSGIDYYEVIEEPIEDMRVFKWGAEDAPWIRTTSPYVLKDQSLNSTIRVRAYDKAGNDYIATLIPDESIRRYGFQQQLLMAVFATIFIALLIAAAVYFVMRRRKNSGATAEGDEDEFEEYEEEFEDDYVDDETK